MLALIGENNKFLLSFEVKIGYHSHKSIKKFNQTDEKMFQLQSIF